jgi:hypothetical protein
MSRSVNKKARITFVDFWPGFMVNDNFFLNLFAESEVAEPIEIHSVYPNGLKAFSRKLKNFLIRLGRDTPLIPAVPSFKKNSETKKIWFTGENVRPPIGEYFFKYLSFDQDSYGGKNLYFPLFYIKMLLLPRDNNRDSRISSIEPDTLLKSRPLPEEKQGFVCVFINNPEPTRLRAIEELSKFGKVDVYGSLTNRKVATKGEVAKDYKYMLCFENDLFPGYITEKLLDAYTCGTVPLYWGLLGDEQFINRKSFINAADFASLSDFAEFVAQLNPEAYGKIYSQPLLSGMPNLNPIIEALQEK